MNVLDAWFSKACKELSLGEELYLEVESKWEAHQKRRALLKLKRQFEEVEPVLASYLDIKTEYRFDRFWVMIRKRAASPLVGFKKAVDGKTTRITIDEDLARERRIKLMLADGMALDEVENIEGRLDDEERKLFER